MIDIFLSSSVPLPTRDRKFFDTADVLLIREAIRSVVEVVLPVGRITCGGHPAITPLLSLFVHEASLESDRVTIFQSEFFPEIALAEESLFANVRIVPPVGHDRAASLKKMREEMISSRPFAAAVVIGGMEGIFEEVDIFSRRHPSSPILPLASTGAAAAIVHKQGNYDPLLSTDLTYSSLLRRRLPLG